MCEEQRRRSEARTGILTFLAGVWLVAAPPLLDFQAAQHAFRPYWTALVLAMVIMVVGMLRALAPLEVPWLRTVNVALAAVLVGTAYLDRTGINPVVQVNQVVVGAAIGVVSLVVAIDSGKWLG